MDKTVTTNYDTFNWKKMWMFNSKNAGYVLLNDYLAAIFLKKA